MDILNDVVLLSEEPARFSWVGVQGFKKIKTAKERCTSTSHFNIGKVRKVHENGTLDINYFKEVDPGLWNVSIDTGVEITRDRVIVLKPPSYKYRKQTKRFGYELPKTIRSVVSSYFKKK